MSRRAKRHAHFSSTGSPAHGTASGGPANGSEHVPDEIHSEHRAGLFPEKYFRWRAGEITRLEAFCDVVFGFALTLLVVSLEVPHSYGELIADMRGFLPFGVCFTQLVMIWITHYRFSRRYGLQDSYTVVLNMVLLFLVLLYVYPLKFVFTLVFSQLTGANLGEGIGWHEASVLMRIYALGFASVFTLYCLMYGHAYKLRGVLGLNAAEIHQTRASQQACVILVGVGLLSLIVSFKSPAWAGWIYSMLGPTMAIQGSIAGKKTRALAEA